jgi:hypothetical protein
MKSANELMVAALQKEFNYNMLRLKDPKSFFNVWVMAVSVISFAENEQTADLLPYRLDDADERNRYMQMGVPTHIAKVVCRTTGHHGTDNFMDGTIVYFIVEEQEQIATCGIWDETWNDGNPVLHGGSMTSAFRWLTKLPMEIIQLQMKDPYLSLEQLESLNLNKNDFLQD